jgi:hypothetical protein
MPRRSTKKFDFAKGVYYFNINKGYNSSITIKRKDKQRAIDAFSSYLKTYKEQCEWLGKWDGKKFTEDNFEKLTGQTTAA